MPNIVSNRSRLKLLLLAGLWPLISAPVAVAEQAAPLPEMVYTYHGPESPNDTRYDFEWAILRRALQRTSIKYGPFRMVASRPLSESQQVEELLSGHGRINIMFRGSTPELMKALHPIRIPVDKNLQGYCVLIANQKNLAKLSRISTLEDLRSLRLGLGEGWVDVDILTANRIKVIPAKTYPDLFHMANQRISDAAVRSVVEVIEEERKFGKDYPDLRIESHILIYYPMPMYFWFSRTDTGRKLAARVEEGMWSMINDGSYDQIFEQYHGRKIEMLGLEQRTLIKLQNPYFTPPERPYSDQRLWLSPSK